MSEIRTSYLVGRADRIVRGRLEQELAESGLSLPELTALSVLAARPGLTNARLARRSLVSPQAMHKVVVSLERQGLVERVASGGRTLGATITQAGLERLAHVEPLRHGVESEFLAPLDETERVEFVRMLTKVCGLAASPSTD